MEKFIFLDIDGTIRDFDGFIPESAILAIRTAREKGHRVCLSTGRPYWQIEKRIMSLGFDGIISGSGSYVVYQGTCVRHQYFTLLTFINLCNYLLHNQCVIELHTYQDSYILREQEAEYESLSRKTQQLIGEKDDRLVLPPRPIESVMEVQEIEKMLFYSDQLSNEEFVKKWGRNLYIVPLSIPSPLRWGGEITPLTVNKAEGMQSILAAGEGFGSEVISVGDSENDIEMLKASTVGVAMGNAPDKVKGHADMVTDPLREDGLLKAFEKLGLV